MLSMFTAVILSYAWLSIPRLSPYSLQLTAVLILLYFFIKWKTKGSVRHVLPAALTAELSVIIAAVLLLVGSTGSTTSLFIPGLYLLLFFAILTVDVATVAVLDFLIVLFLWATTPPPLSGHQIATLLSFPILLPLLLSAKLHHDEMKEQETRSAVEEEQTVLFLSTFLKPKMQHLAHLSNFIRENEKIIRKQIELIQEEIDAFIEKAKSLMERT